jgi:hypothetical protein
MLDIPLLPDEDVVVLDGEATGGPEVRCYYRPLRPREVARLVARLAAADEAEEGALPVYLDAFRERVTRIEGATFGGEPYDPERHYDSVPMPWLTTVGERIVLRSQLSRDDAGKSS